LISEV